jgi:hypothetical protein
MRSSKASGLIGSPSSRASLAPASPPSSKAIIAKASSRRSVLRAWAATSGSLSQKMDLLHPRFSQKKRRARIFNLTETPRQGRSETVRSYRLCTLSERRLHIGHRAQATGTPARTVKSEGPTSTLSGSRPSGSSLRVEDEAALT